MSIIPSELACKQIEFARDYMLSLVETIPDADWFRLPSGAVTHVAWQVGHLAMAEYGLCMFRQRGRRTEDLALMSGVFRKRYSRGSTPDSDPKNQPAPAEIRQVLHRVHESAMRELVAYSESDLQQPIDQPYAVYATRLGALLFCSHHEMIHAGQIGLLRRLLGLDPVR